MLQDLRDRVQAAQDETGPEGGFTLIELLVVITILGILAAVVVFSVAGLGDRGQTAACKTDTVTLRTAEEANYAKFSTYAPMTGANSLVSNGFLSSGSTLHTITSTATTYSIQTASNGTCGAAGSTVTDGSNGAN